MLGIWSRDFGLSLVLHGCCNTLHRQEYSSVSLFFNCKKQHNQESKRSEQLSDVDRAKSNYSQKQSPQGKKGGWGCAAPHPAAQALRSSSDSRSRPRHAAAPAPLKNPPPGGHTMESLRSPSALTARAAAAPLQQPPALTARAAAAPLHQPPALTARAAAAPLHQPPALTARAAAAPLHQPPALTARAAAARLHQPPALIARAAAGPLQSPPAPCPEARPSGGQG